MIPNPIILAVAFSVYFANNELGPISATSEGVHIKMGEGG
jgi:hypothetical protein